VCITRGVQGSVLVSAEETVQHNGFPVKLRDEIGAGGAFAACLAHEYLRDRSLEEINESANRLASWVATQTGATPPVTTSQLRNVLKGEGFVASPS